MFGAYRLPLRYCGGCTTLGHLYLVYLCIGVEVPDSTGVFQDGSDNDEITLSLCLN